MKRWTRVMTVTAFLGVLCIPSAALEAQQRGQRRGPPRDRAELEMRVRQRFGQMIRDRLGLEEAQGEQLGEVMRGFAERRRELARSEEATRRRVEALLLDGGEAEGEARELVERLMELREEEAALFREEQEALLQVLTPVQLLQFHALREQMNRRVRELRGGGPPGMGPGGGGGHPGVEGELQGAFLPGEDAIH